MKKFFRKIFFIARKSSHILPLLMQEKITHVTEQKQSERDEQKILL
jgi:hypothetical protein